MIHRLMSRQADFVEAIEPEILFDGGYASGKTRALCAKVVWQATLPGSFVGLTRKTFASLRHNTLRTLLHAEGELPPLLTPDQYEHNKTEHLIQIHGGGTIHYFGCDNPERLGGIAFSAIGVDEASELDEDEYLRLLGCLRNKRTRALQVFSVTNPGKPSHFLYGRFIQPSGVSTPAQREAFQRRRRITTTYRDLAYRDRGGKAVNCLPQITIDNLESFTGQRRARYVEGLWVAFEGLVYDMFLRAAGGHLRERDERWVRAVLGVDLGFRHPSVICELGIDATDRTHQLGEFYKVGMFKSELIAVILARCREHADVRRRTTVVVDPSEPEFIETLRAELAANGMTGVQVKAADNAVADGIRLCQDRLRLDAGGAPYHTISSVCEQTIREIEAYQWDSRENDKPVKEYDHAMDAWRYAMMEALNESARKKTKPAAATTFVRQPRFEMVGADRGWEPI